VCAAPVDLSKVAVLTLDDDFSMRSVIREVLRECGCRNVFSTGSGNVALEMLEKNRIDLALCDMQMDEMDGLSFMRKARQHWRGRDMAAIMLTAGKQPDDEAALAPLRIGTWLFKPISTKKLLEGVSKVLGGTVGEGAAGERAARAVADLAQGYAAKLSEDIAKLEATMAALPTDNDALRDVWTAMRKSLHSIKGQAGTFGYSLVTKLAQRAHDALVDALAVPGTMPESGEVNRALHTIVTAMGMVAQGRLRGDGGEAGAALLRKLDAFIIPLRQRLQAKIPRPGAVEELVWADGK
jgi:two-component system, chemotaxis family, chemotaxis protein CheY